VAIARALINDPVVLLADEPTGSLDSATGRDVMNLLLELRTRLGMTLLVATHDMDVAVRCDRMLTLRDGSIVSDTVVDNTCSAEVLSRIGRLHGDA
jgi:putative ABC transport system ATP-binding protein